jgi:hypothetical protein
MTLNLGKNGRLLFKIGQNNRKAGGGEWRNSVENPNGANELLFGDEGKIRRANDEEPQLGGRIGILDADFQSHGVIQNIGTKI